MPPDTKALVRKFIPNNGKLADAVTRVCENTFKVRVLPQQLVKMVVTRSFELVRGGDVDTDDKVFFEKLTEYASSLRPRFINQINEANRRGKNW